MSRAGRNGGVYVSCSTAITTQCPDDASVAGILSSGPIILI